MGKQNTSKTRSIKLSRRLGVNAMNAQFIGCVDDSSIRNPMNVNVSVCNVQWCCSLQWPYCIFSLWCVLGNGADCGIAIQVSRSLLNVGKTRTKD